MQRRDAAALFPFKDFLSLMVDYQYDFLELHSILIRTARF